MSRWESRSMSLSSDRGMVTLLFELGADAPQHPLADTHKSRSEMPSWLSRHLISFGSKALTVTAFLYSAVICRHDAVTAGPEIGDDGSRKQVFQLGN